MAHKRLVSKLHPGLGNKYSKNLLSKKLVEARERQELIDSSLRTSSKFFARLQEEVREEVRANQGTNVTEKSSRTISGQIFKL